MRYTGPKARRARRLGVNLYGSDKYDRILQRRTTAPGKGPKGHRGNKLSEYGRQLLEKQKVAAVYGVHDRQLGALYTEASRRIGQTDKFIKSSLERRVDSALFRAGLANTRMQARQFISHGLFTVNGRRVKTPSLQLKIGDTVAVRERAKTSAVFAPIIQAHERYMPPDWLKVDSADLRFEVTALPIDEKHFEQSIDMRKVIGFYSR